MVRILRLLQVMFWVGKLDFVELLSLWERGGVFGERAAALVGWSMRFVPRSSLGTMEG